MDSNDVLPRWLHGTLVSFRTQKTMQKRRKGGKIRIHLNVAFCQSILIFEKFLAESLKNLHTS